MLVPVLPENEASRVAALRRTGLLDTEPEERFDRVTRLAQRVLGVPIALVSLVDDDRQWFKSKQGLEASETPREISFCGHAINSSDVLHVADATIDPRFADNPLVTGDPRIQFYAGCPIAAPDGSLIGTLCVMDRSPRNLDPDELLTLRDLAAIVENELAISQLAVDDELTGLQNRRGFELLANQTMAWCRRQGTPVTVLFGDIDGLKNVNDTFGHEVGDQLIKAVADVFKVTFRGADVVARVGGDEFAVLLAGEGGDPTPEVQRLLSGIDAADSARGNAPYRISVSVGAARSASGDTDSLGDLVNRADAAMYAMKHQRRILRRDASTERQAVTSSS